MDFKKISVALLVTGLLLISLGCTTTDNQAEVSAGELESKVVSASSNVSSYEFVMNTDVSMAANGMNMTVSIGGDGVVSVEDKEMHFNMETGENEFEAYLVDGLLYENVEFGNTSKWIKINLSENYSDQWSSSNQLDQMRKLIESSDIEVVGTEEIDGTECYKVEVYPSLEEYWSILENTSSLGSSQQSLTGELNVSAMEDAIEEFNATYWISKDSYLPQKTTLEMDMSINQEQLDINYNMSIISSVSFESYNQPVDVVLSEDAENAVPLENFTINGSGS
ncbi:MAG: hypothetical protein BTN85_1266 [Candidatus Methanohalarchaeum thermophilum]|uniref:Lipoprotein n=1 Tax=Methanohalarchaeum thermophilum TaxID=1903181 RepID=A0A1Q6DWP5_METT1|nr:MAG: hypothetical protein BTN85_1266 [Candidatus Methanohalarchaeum thermophilum]